MGSLTEFVELLASIVAGGGDTMPERICRACVANLPVTGAAITVMSSADRQEPVCATDVVAARLDELQFRLAEGPCVEAFAERRPVLVADLADGVHARWPVFAEAARRTPARALHVFPLQVGAVVVGVLDLYHVRPGLLEPEALTGALRTADAAVWSLLGLRSGQASNGRSAEIDPHGWLFGTPLERTEVYQATGMIIAQLDVSAETALARLRAYAFSHDRPIDEVARDVVDRRLRFAEERW